MAGYDRLSALMQYFQMEVAPCAPQEADLLIFGAPGAACEVVFASGGTAASGSPCAVEEAMFAARVGWGGAVNPLLQALPAQVRYRLKEDAEAQALVSVLMAENRAQRCGADSVLSRLCEILLVRLLRHQIAEGSTAPGLLAGLSDPRLSRAIVAMHDQPARQWRTEDLAREAGLSLSRFSELFAARVGETPMAYLRRWRLTIAQRDLARGDRVEAVARRYGYGSPEGFTRAYKRAHGAPPMAARLAERAA
ncbi:AraC family transcriptional regulator [Pseudoruegeria sp. SHC-113]|uniref:AraC family transcriptional regulator n=1 Tax=Pseudoruegeria sp. SHC-113 TaxID=2855439 RepID=UPI0021BB352C|nr:AraC family transcriptional regulator [Pseudoruegeria sp. SHC-113]MCT8159865.1 AraC family transcriptional regulator [Pseudoruegeria sp. SHC-113]